MAQIDFEYETEEGFVLYCTADITPGRPMVYPSLSGPGEPAEDPTIEIVSVKVKDFDLAIDVLEEAAWANAEDQGDW